MIGKVKVRTVERCNLTWRTATSKLLNCNLAGRHTCCKETGHAGACLCDCGRYRVEQDDDPPAVARRLEELAAKVEAREP